MVTPAYTAEDIVRLTVAEHVPSETAHIDTVTRLCTEDPVIMYRPAGRRPGPLADGLSLVMVVVAPVLYGVLNDLARQAAETGIRALCRRLIRLGRRVMVLRPAEPLRAFTPEQVLYASSEVTRRLLRHGVPADEAAAIAAGFAAHLEAVR